MAEKVEMGDNERRDVLFDDEELNNTMADRFLLNLVTIVFTLMVSIVMLQVVVRYFLSTTFGISFHWTEESARYLMIVTAFLGSAVAWRKRENISISFFTDLLPKKANVFLKFFTDLIALGFALICTYGAYLMSIRMANSPLGTLPIGKTGNVYFLMAICFALISFYIIRWLIFWIRQIIKLRSVK